MAYDAFASAFTVSGSAVSCLATLAVLLFCLASTGRHASLCHALIVNLCLAEFLNTFNTTISGFIYMDLHRLQPGRACRANGFFVLMTAQAVDFTILTIGLVTLSAVIHLLHLPDLSSRRTRWLICSSTWAIPFITSLAALTMDALRPVDMNWCEISAARPGLRYALARGWRLAIMLLVMCLYTFLWWFGRRHRSFCSAASGMKAPCSIFTSMKTTRPTLTTSASSASSRAGASVPAAARPSRRAKLAGCSEFSLPLQGYDGSGADFQEREQAIDSRTERISRWIYVRHPGLINSISALTPQSQSRLLIPQASSGPPATRVSNATADRKSQGFSLAKVPPSCPPLSLRPHHHVQCPKLQSAFGFSTPQRPEIGLPSPVTVERQSLRSRYYGYAKSVNPARPRAQSYSETSPWKICAAGRPTQVQWPFCDNSSNPVLLSTRDSTTAASEKSSAPGSRYYSHCSRVTRSSNDCVDHKDMSPGPLPPVHQEINQDSSQLYRSKDLWTQDPLTLTNRGHEDTPEHSGPLHHNEFPARCSIEISTGRAQNSAVSMPKCYSQWPKVKHTIDVPVDLPQERRPGPNYHSRCPKVTKTVSVSPSGPVLSKSPSITYEPGIYCTQTTIVTAPGERPPSPIPGLPPPPWSPEAKAQRRKTFLLSKSTWSDSTLSGRSLSASDTARNEREIRRMLLLNAYPLSYFILWLPWMVNCFMEAQGHSPEHPAAMHALLGLPQYLGLVSAATFAVNESLKTARRKVRTVQTGRADNEKASFGSEVV